MRYISTRSQSEPKKFTDILLEGLAGDGGLYLPEYYPNIAPKLAKWRVILANQGYAALAAEVLQLFIDDIPTEDIKAICRHAYCVPKFSDERIVPVSQLSDELWLAHTSLGPTAAFKDMAMQLLGELFDYELARRNQTLTILGATSGDTGSAAEYALIGKTRIKVFMLTPAGRMTPFQQAQMFSLDDPSIVNIAVDGVFDDCQDLVKAVNADAFFKEKYHIGAVNSINWARLLAQIVYYIAAWLQVSTTPDQQISFAVPTGNFGNICAAHIARQMGLPIKRLILATNENNVLDEFIRTGNYRVRTASDTYETSSPSMDISKASNFERFIFDLLGRDSKVTAQLFGAILPTDGQFNLSNYLTEIHNQFGFDSGCSTHADRIATIQTIYATTNIILDPHTADAVHIAQQLDHNPTVVIETALPIKFESIIRTALGITAPRPMRFAGIEQLPRKVINIPNSVQKIKDIICHEASILF